jgi:spheroidene monooxygenase
MGSGRGGGFGLLPSWRHQGLIAFFDDEATAEAFLAHHPAVQACRARAREWLALTMRATSSRGSWDGTTLAVTAPTTPGQSVAALTRASIRPSRMAAFWRHAPPSEASLAGAPGCRLAVGLGEAPLLRQCTFSIWDSQAAMDAFARHGAHQAAIHASHDGRFFSEWMFVRLAVLRTEGAWPGWRHG